MNVRLAGGLLSALAFACTLLAQPPGRRSRPAEDTPPPPTGARALQPTSYAIVNAKVVPEPGKVWDKATILIDRGVITAAGPDVAAPPTALTVNGNGLTVYPGLIDACSHWGIDLNLRRSEGGPPAPEDLASEPQIATKIDNRKGVTPEFDVSTALKDEPELMEAWRKAGFTVRLAAPDGGLMAGQSAVVSLSGRTPREAVLRSAVALHAGFQPPPGDGYPRVLMGGVAHFRQSLLDAGYFRMIRERFPDAARRTLDPTYESLTPYLSGVKPVVFEADTRDEIHRALDFASEFKLKPIVSGGREAWKVTQRLKSERVPVLLKVGRDEPDAEREKQLTPWVRQERQRLRDEATACAAQLHKAGVRFALVTRGGSGDKPSEKFADQIREVIGAGLPADAALAALTTTPAELLGITRQAGRISAGADANLVLTKGDLFADGTKIQVVFADGVRFDFTPPDDSATPADKKPERPKKPEKPAPFIGPPTLADSLVEFEADRVPAVRTGGTVLLKNATVLTGTGQTLPATDVLIVTGKIQKIGPNLQPPTDAVKILDLTGRFVMPGIIDTHSHFAVDGSVNEFSLSAVPEVRIADVIDGDDVQIYRAAAGGVTTARILHGSANCVGGQHAVLKMKYGQPARDLFVPGAPRGVKFALGENVKRTDGRFPNTRMGVEAVLVRAFSEANEYRKQWQQYESSKIGPPPRRDLRLEALADMLKGDLKIHCHCYRSDEILMLLRVADRFGVKIQSLQHVLEGYKIAPEIAAHGASCSLFSDWWAYKIEAFDAIPYAAALLHEAGAQVCLKSDSNELMRHMYQEAAKCVKYGGMSPDEALKTITLNAAKQLKLDDRIGSIEVGKDADIAVFNGHPLNGYSRVEATLIDGEIFFDRPGASIPEFAKSPPAAPRPALKLPEKSSTVIAVRGATVHPVSGPVIRNGTVVIERGRIRAVGTNGEAVIPPQATVIDAEGLHLYPGLIDAGTVIGLTELESARETLDFREGGDFQPDLRASVAVNPDSELIPVTRANGVTTVVTRPTGSVIAGQGALINLAGWVPTEMAVVDPVALQIEFPSSSPFFAMFDPTVPFGRGLAKRHRR